MENILLISHGQLASGLKSAAEIITGKQDNLYTIDMYLDEKALEVKLENLDIDLNSTLIFTDIFGGSVNQKIMSIIDIEKTPVIAGVNLAILIEILTIGIEKLTDDKINEIIEGSREQIVYVNEILKEELLSQDDF